MGLGDDRGGLRPSHPVFMERNSMPAKWLISTQAAKCLPHSLPPNVKIQPEQWGILACIKKALIEFHFLKNQIKTHLKFLSFEKKNTDSGNAVWKTVIVDPGDARHTCGQSNAYSEVSPIAVSRAYSQGCVPRNAALGVFKSFVCWGRPGGEVGGWNSMMSRDFLDHQIVCHPPNIAGCPPALQCIKLNSTSNSRCVNSSLKNKIPQSCCIIRRKLIKRVIKRSLTLKRKCQSLCKTRDQNTQVFLIKQSLCFWPVN